MSAVTPHTVFDIKWNLVRVRKYWGEGRRANTTQNTVLALGGWGWGKDFFCYCRSDTNEGKKRKRGRKQRGRRAHNIRREVMGVNEVLFI